MRIALLSYEYPPETGFGGIGTYTYYQAHALARLGHEVHVFAGTDHAERRTYRDGNVTVTRMRKVGFVERLLPRAARRLGWFQNRVQNAVNSFSALRRELRRQRFDVVEMPECGAEGAVLNQCFDLPTVVRLHSPAELIMPTYDTNAADRLLTAMVERLGINGARAVSSCSHWLAKEVRQRMRVQRPIAVIPNGIDLARFDEDEGIDVHERFGVPRGGVRVFFANRLEPRKGIHVVRDLLVPVLDKHPDVTFVLAGADPDGVVDRELRPLLAARGRSEALVHLGRVDLAVVRACLKQTDVFLLPSIWENAPYSMLEAMAAGKAIVASDCGGVPEMVRHEIDGVIARTGDATSFAKAIDRALHPGMRARLGQAARARVEARFTDEVVVRRSLEFYEWALGAHVGRVPAAAAEPVAVLGPENWFQAAWLRASTTRERPVAAAAFADLGLDELAFVHAVLARSYWTARGRAETDEAAFLGELEAVHRERALAAVASGAAAPARARLALPATSHPVFGDDASAEALLDELWRLRDSAAVTEWLQRELARPDFVEVATRRVALRRLAIEGLRRRLPVALDVLRRVYRSIATAARVVQQDQEFIATDAKGKDLADAVAAYGLHAPLQRPAVFPPDRKRKSPGPRTTAAVTVLIPSFRHEAYVARAITSALEQTVSPERVLVVDDRSPDGTVAAASAVADPRVEVRTNDANLGLGGSVRAALASITTPFVAMLNSDDVFHPERLARCLALLEADPSAQLVTSGLAVMDSKERRLTGTTASVLDLGPAAHGWVHWYERVTAGLSATNAITVPALLRHNHLATSSNLVCRTDWLRSHAERWARLQYCLDWSLFLQAAVEGSLRHVPEALLGYRLHDSNTVWFGDDARPGYVHEVNAVVAEALRAHVEQRRAAGVEGEPLAEEIAALLLDSVDAHGETDGFVLALADLLRGAEVVPAAFRSPQLVRMAQRALARHASTVPAGSAHASAAQHAVTALTRRLAALEPRVGKAAHDSIAASELYDDSVVLRQRLDSELASAAVRLAETEALRGTLASTTGELQRTAAELAATSGALADARAGLAAANDSLSAVRDEAARTGETLAATRRDLAATTAALQASQEDCALAAAALRAERDASADRYGELAAQHAAAVAERDDAELRSAADAALAERRLRERVDALERLEEGIEYRVGRFLVRKSGLGGVAKTLLRVGTGMRVGAGRLFAGLRKQVPGRKPMRVLFATERPFPDADSLQLATQVMVARGEGFDARVVCWRGGATAALPEALQCAVCGRAVLAKDAALQGRDRRWWARRRPEVVATLQAFPIAAGAQAMAFTFARAARSLGAFYVHAEGLGAMAFAVFAAGRLVGVQYGLRLRAQDLPSLHGAHWREVVARAAAVVVDNDAMVRGVEAAMGGRVPAMLVQAPLMSSVVRRPAAARDPSLLACIGPFASPRGLLALADACKILSDRGTTLRVEVLGGGDDSLATARALDWLRGRLAEHGLLDNFMVRDHDGEPHAEELLARANALFDARVPPPHEPIGGGAAVGAALAGGVPVVGFAGAVDPAVRDGREGLLVPLAAGAPALAAALTDLFGDVNLRERLAASARRRHAEAFAPEVASAEFTARLRALRNIASG